MIKRSLVLIGALFFLSATPSAVARNHPDLTAPGTYKQWGPDIDQIEILQTFKMSEYDTVIIDDFDTSDVTDENADVQRVLRDYTNTFTQAFKRELKAKVRVDREGSATDRLLLVRGRVEALHPGSRPARVFNRVMAVAGVGLLVLSRGEVDPPSLAPEGVDGAAAGTRITAEIIDGATGEVLVRFTQERWAGGVFKFAGGSNVRVMRDSIHAEGQDLAHILDTF